MGKLVQVANLEQHSDRVWHVSWSFDGKYLASCSGDKTICVYMQQNDQWTCVSTLEDAQSRTLRSCEWSHCGKFIASTSFDATTVIWEKMTATEFQIVATLEGHESEVKSVSWNREGTYLATCSRDKSVWIWEADPNTDFECISVLHGHAQDVKFLTWHPTESILFSASYDNSIRVWQENDDDFYCSETLTGHSSTVWGLALDASGNRLVSCSDDKTLIVWHHTPEAAGWTQAQTLSGFHNRPIFSVDWSASGLIVTGDAENCIRIFAQHNQTFELVHQQAKAHDGDVNCVRWNAQDSLLASAGDDGVVTLWQYIRDD